eukprot:c11381_g1_i1 orf=156-590(+)
MAASSAVSSSTSGLALAKNCTLPASSTPPSAPSKVAYLRRLLLPALVGAPFLLRQQAATAKDIPLFGIRKRVDEAEKVVKELVKEGEQLVKEGEKEIGSVVAPVILSTPINSPPPTFQAAGVAGAELVAVLIASSVVNGLVSNS